MVADGPEKDPVERGFAYRILAAATALLLSVELLFFVALFAVILKNFEVR